MSEFTDWTDMGRDASQTKYIYTFIHNVYADFFRDMLEYFSAYLYPRFEHTVMGTFDKAVEYLTKGEQYDREMDMPMKSALILNPTGEFTIAEGNAGGKQLWRFPNLAPGFAPRLFDPVYQDANVKVSPGFLRIKGEVELIMMVDSFYEYCDLRMLLLNIFGGTDRPIEPEFFTSFIILGSSILNYHYSNPYTGLNYNLDWSGAGASQTLVKTTGRNEMVLPVKIKPQITLSSLSDASTRYGGPDSLPEWRLNATLNYEVELPTWLILESDYLAEHIRLEVRYGSAFSEYDLTQSPPINRQFYSYDWDWGLDETSHSTLNLRDSTSCEPYVTDAVFSTRYYYVITQAEIDSTSSTINITIPETVSNRNFLMVWSYAGEMSYKDHYDIIDSGTTLAIRKDTVNLRSRQIIELYMYKEI